MRPVRLRRPLRGRSGPWCSPMRSAGSSRLPIDDRISGALVSDGSPHPIGTAVAVANAEVMATLSPRDIQSHPGSAPASPPRTSPRVAGVPGRPRAPIMRARSCRNARCWPSTPAAPGSRRSDSGAPLSEGGRRPARAARPSTPRRSPGTRIGARTAPGASSPTWPSGKATRAGDLGSRQGTPGGPSAPHDRHMAQYLCAERAHPRFLGQDPPVPERPMLHERGGHGLPGPSRTAEPRPRWGAVSARGPATTRPARTATPIRAGRDALLAGMDPPR